MVAFPASISARSCPGHYVHIQSNTDTVPSKHAGSHLEAFWLRPVMAIAASVQPESGRIVYAGSHFALFFFFFSSVFPKMAWAILCKNRPGSDLDGLVRVWLSSSGLKTSRCAGIIAPGFWQDATGLLLVSHFQSRFRSSTDVPENIIQNLPGSDLVLVDCARFGSNGSGPEASQCARIIRTASGQCFQADLDRMRIGSGMFTGYDLLGFRLYFSLYVASSLNL